VRNQGSRPGAATVAAAVTDAADRDALVLGALALLALAAASASLLFLVRRAGVAETRA
jgi:hypothetical protein